MYKSVSSMSLFSIVKYFVTGGFPPPFIPYISKQVIFFGTFLTSVRWKLKCFDQIELIFDVYISFI